MNFAGDKNIKGALVNKGNALSQHEIFRSDNINICWNEMFFNQNNKIRIHEKGKFMELHFQFNGYCKTLNSGKKPLCTMFPNSQSIFYINNFECEHVVHKDNFNPFSFFEIKLGYDAVKKIFPEELWNELNFARVLLCGTTSFIGSVKPITPQMRCIIYNMCNCPFKGVMADTYLEAKVIELFLLQVESHKPTQNNDLKKDEIDKLIVIKEFIDKNYHKRIRIVDLAKIAGTNQQMLKTGFKRLFGTTIFAYYNDLRMEKAKYLLLDRGKRVAEVSDEIGYKNPQHFTVAFKKKFGLLPSDLKG